ncbi:hypothetical protein RN001_016044 [Aquatica leii]|uniref:Uncharacterized protein n=1 Tax=Aquatica leii TaxID=1421715 RepID=A0AAN7SMZ7_9COLE|nr:hypothetical protein RN001_016044 [Aquatica leii]
MQMQNIDYLGITETKRKGKGEMELNEGHWLYWSGVEQEEWGAKGVGLIVKADKVKNIREERYINERLLGLNIKIDNEEGSETAAIEILQFSSSLAMISFWPT